MADRSLAATRACVFDAYGTLFDLTSAARRCADGLGPKAEAVGTLWRTRQVEYSWLRSLKRAGRPAAILSNGSPRMLSAAVQSAGLGPFLDHVVSIEEAGTYKPHPRVYELMVRRLDLDAEHI